MKNSGENRNKNWVAGIALAFAILGINILVVGSNFSLSVAKANAEGDESERNEDHESGIVAGQAEDQEDGERDEGAEDVLSGVNNIGGIVLVGTIAVISGVGGYAGYKLLKIKQKSIEIKSKLNTAYKKQEAK